MGLRVVCRAMLAVLLVCGVSSVGFAQAVDQTTEQPSAAASPSDAVPTADAASQELEGSGAIVPPEVAFASNGGEQEATSDVPPPEDARTFYDRHRRFNSFGGPTGGFHLVDPSTGVPGSFRIQLATSFFSSSDYLLEGDDVDVTQHALSLSWTATELIELFATLTSRASDYEIPDSLATGSMRTQSLSATGDLSLGMKVAGDVTSVLSLGGDARILLNSGEGQASPELAATGLALRASAAIDLRKQPEPVPFIARFNVGYTIDNSAQLVTEREDARYGQIRNPRSKPDETRHLANRFERLAFGMNRVDMIGLGIGLELPLFVAEDFYLHPLLEWTWGIPLNRQAYDCPQLMVDGAGSADNVEDSCLDSAGLKASPMTLTLGLRVVTPARGLSLFGGVDIGLLGTSSFVRELAPNAPYAVLLGVSVDYDARPAPVQIVEREVVVEAPVQAPVRGRIQGVVVDQNSGSPVVRANVRFADQALSALQTGDDGSFVSFDLPPGEVRYQATHPDYESTDCVAVIPAEGGSVDARCAMAALPRKGSLKLRITDVWGAAVPGASVQLNGPVVVSVNAGSDGVAQSDDLAAGQYTVRVDAPNHYLRVLTVEITPRQTKLADLSLTPRVGPSRAELRGTEVRFTGTVRFARGSGEIDAALAPVIADLADLLLRNPQLARVRIEGPADAGGDPMLGLTRALAIKQRLVDAGVDGGRINAVGGATPKLRVVSE